MGLPGLYVELNWNPAGLTGICDRQACWDVGHVRCEMRAGCWRHLGRPCISYCIIISEAGGGDVGAFMQVGVQAGRL